MTKTNELPEKKGLDAPRVSVQLHSPEYIKEQAYIYSKTGHDKESYDVKEKRAFEAGARWALGYEKDG